MRLHVPSLPWTQTTSEFVTCAYTQKVVKFCQMMMSLDYEVVLYSGEHNEAPCTEHVVCYTDAEQEEWFGKFDANDPWTKVSWDPADIWWRTLNSRAAKHMSKRGWTPREDVLCFISGWCHRPIADEIGYNGVTNEWGIGYEGVCLDYHLCFESQAWMHYVYGKHGVVNGRWYDTVIPNSFDPEDFTFNPDGGDYLLFIGRLVQRKGPHVAAQIADRLGKKLVVAGPGAVAVEPGRIITPEVTIEGRDIEYVGPVGKAERDKLMGGAAACIVPTFYIEPFGGVSIEAMLTGTPVIASDFGVFPETVREGETGARFRTLDEGARAVERAIKLPREGVRAAAERYSIWNVRHEYDAWYKRLDQLWGEGWYS